MAAQWKIFMLKYFSVNITQVSHPAGAIRCTLLTACVEACSEFAQFEFCNTPALQSVFYVMMKDLSIDQSITGS